jgi:hypothetical protein
MVDNIMRTIGGFFLPPGALDRDPRQTAGRYIPPGLLNDMDDDTQAAYGQFIQSQVNKIGAHRRPNPAQLQEMLMSSINASRGQRAQEQLQGQLAPIFGGGGAGGAPAPAPAGAAPNPAITQAITSAAQRHGVDPNAMIMIAGLESRFDPMAQNPKSSAAGLFQFIDKTADQYGLQNRYDPVESADAAARLMRDNQTALQRSLGRAPTPAELYLAHQQGATGAARLLQNPDKPAVDVVGRNAVMLNGGSEDMTAGQFANMWMSRAQGGAAQPGQAAQPAQGGQGGQAGYDRKQAAERYFQAAKVFASRGDPETAKKYVDMGMQLHPNPSEAVRDLEYFGFPMQGQGQGAFDRLSQLNQSRAGNTSINMPQNQFGSIPPGHRLKQNPDGSYEFEVIPGSPAAREIEAQNRADQFKQQNLERAGGTVVQDVGRALEILGTAGPFGAGRGAVVGRLDPESTASALNDLVTSVKGNIGVDQLQQMRNASPTGGALGNVTERQLEGLQGLLGSLKVEGRRELLEDNLKRVFNLYMDQIHGTPEQIRALAATAGLSPEVVEVLTFRHQLSFDELGRPVRTQRGGQQSGGGRPGLNEIFSPRQ